MTPIHDWSPVDAGLFHHFHQRWIAAISDSLNSGVLPDMALFLTADSHVPTPLAATYETTWNVCPGPLKNAVLAKT